MDLPLVAVHGEASCPDTIRAEAREVDLQRQFTTLWSAP
jgi:hypothetical protein